MGTDRAFSTNFFLKKSPVISIYIANEDVDLLSSLVKNDTIR